MATSTLSPVTFHGDTLHILDHNGEPFTPMKPIVENMGLGWRTQQRKLDTNRERWGMVIMTTPSPSGVTVPCSASYNPLRLWHTLAHQ